MDNSKIVTFDENKLSKVLENNYGEILKSMQKEDYILEYDSFCEFREILFDGKSVGFLTLDTFIPTEKSLCLNECYILPEFRGKNLLISIIREFLKDDSFSFYIRRPNYSFIKFLLKHDLAFEVSNNLVSSSIKFVVRADEAYSNKFIKRIYKKVLSQKDLTYYAAAYHMDFCSVFFFDHIAGISKKPQTTVFVLPRKEDLKKHQARKKLNKLTIKGIEKIQYNYAINNDKIDEFNNKIKSDDVNNEDFLVYGKNGEVIVNDNLKPNDLIKIDKAINREGNMGNLTDKSSELRMDYLLENIDKIDKKINYKKLKGNAKHLAICPFCGNYCTNNDFYCAKCGQVVIGLFEKKSNPFSLKNILRMNNNINQFNQKGYVGDYNLDDKIVKHCFDNGYDIEEVFEVQKELTVYETVKFISNNRIYFNLPSFYHYNHIKDCWQDEWAYELGYLRKISVDEYVDRIHNEYTYEELVNEVEIEGMRFSDEEMKEEIARLKKYTEHWVRDIYEITPEGIEFINSPKPMDIFSKYLTGFIYYEFERYWRNHKDESDLEICDGFVKNQYSKLDKMEIIRYYINYLWYKFRVYKKQGDKEKMIIKILQIAIYNVNMRFLKEEYSFTPFGTETIDLFKYLDNIDEYYDLAFDEFKLDLLKDRKDKVYKALKIYLNGDETYIRKL